MYQALKCYLGWFDQHWIKIVILAQVVVDVDVDVADYGAGAGAGAVIVIAIVIVAEILFVCVAGDVAGEDVDDDYVGEIDGVQMIHDHYCGG